MVRARIDYYEDTEVRIKTIGTYFVTQSRKAANGIEKVRATCLQRSRETDDLKSQLGNVVLV